MPVYLIFLLIFFVFPLFMLWLLYWKTLVNYKKTFILTVIPTFILGVPWDSLSVVTGLWRYDSAATLGIWFPPGGEASGILPVEELFFTLVFPVFVVTITIVVKEILRASPSG